MSVVETNFAFEIIGYHSEGDSERDMETAIETVCHSWSNHEYLLKSPAGLLISLTDRFSHLSYSIVGGYHEGGEDMGGEQARPPTESRTVTAEFFLPPKDERFSVEEFKEAIGWIREHHGDADVFDSIPGRDMAERAANVLLRIDPADKDALKLPREQCDDPRFGGVVHVTIDDESVIALLDQLPGKVILGRRVQLSAPAAIADTLQGLNAAAREITAHNDTIRLDNVMSSSQARVRLNLEKLFDSIPKTGYGVSAGGRLTA
jgi:hypothetical protein